MTTECPNCGMDNAYCDGVEYVCPDCYYTWLCDEIPEDYEWESDEEDDDIDCEIYVNGRKQQLPKSIFHSIIGLTIG